MKLTKTRLKQIIKEEVLKKIQALKEEKSRDKLSLEDILSKYQDFAGGTGRPLDKEDTFLAFIGQWSRLFNDIDDLSKRSNPNDHYEDLAQLYKEFIAPTQEKFYTRKAEVEEELASLEGKERADKPYMGAKEMSSSRKRKERKSELRTLKAILDYL